MAYDITAGNTYRVSESKPCRCGDSQRGTWRMVFITDDNGKYEQSLFVKNEDCGLEDGKFITSFTVDKIVSVTRGIRKVGETWRDSLTINCEGHATDEQPHRVITDGGELPF